VTRVVKYHHLIKNVSGPTVFFTGNCILFILKNIFLNKFTKSSEKHNKSVINYRCLEFCLDVYIYFANLLIVVLVFELDIP